MIFRFQFLVSSFWPWNALRYTLTKPVPSTVLIERAIREQQPQNAVHRDTLTTVLLTRSPKQEIHDALRAIADRLLPKESDPSKVGNMRLALDSEGLLLPDHAIPTEVLPEKLLRFCNQMYSEANAALELVESYHRWRFDLDGPYTNRHGYSSMFSFDEVNWAHVPLGYRVGVEVRSAPAPISVQQQREVENWLNTPVEVVCLQHPYP